MSYPRSSSRAGCLYEPSLEALISPGKPISVRPGLVIIFKTPPYCGAGVVAVVAAGVVVVGAGAVVVAGGGAVVGGFEVAGAVVVAGTGAAVVVGVDLAQLLNITPIISTSAMEMNNNFLTIIYLLT
jgi:hypothetical protein